MACRKMGCLGLDHVSMVAEAMVGYALASAEVAYKYPGEQAPMVPMEAGGGFNYGNDSHWWYQKHP